MKIGLYKTKNNPENFFPGYVFGSPGGSIGLPVKLGHVSSLSLVLASLKDEEGLNFIFSS